MKTTLDHVKEVAKSSYTFWFNRPKNYTYIAGQFIELTLSHQPVDDRGTRRWFTLSSSPTEPLLSITTRFSDKPSSFKESLRQLKTGAEVDISSPMGDFVLPKDPSIPLVFIAIGIGATPFRSMTNYLHDQQLKRNICMIHAAKEPDLIVFRQEFQKNIDTYHEITDSRLSVDLVLRLTGPPAGKYFYISGPEPAVEQIEAELKKHGIKSNHVFTDFFHNYT